MGAISPLAAQHAIPLPRAHAHNDYEHDRPLLEALERGFGSVEVDIHLVEGDLLVAHDLEDVQIGRTIQSLYLDPLRKHIQMNEGVVYKDAPSLILLIDIKSQGEATYAVLREVLRGYEDILTRFEGESVIEGPVTAIISGNRPRAVMKGEVVRWAAYDGRLSDLGSEAPESVSFIPLISSNWNQIESWYGDGAMSDAGRTKLRQVVSQAHKEGRIIRFWATSNNPVVWDTLYEAGVDLLNADDLEALQALLLNKRE